MITVTKEVDLQNKPVIVIMLNGDQVAIPIRSSSYGFASDKVVAIINRLIKQYGDKTRM